MGRCTAPALPVQAVTVPGCISKARAQMQTKQDKGDLTQGHQEASGNASELATCSQHRGMLGRAPRVVSSRASLHTWSLPLPCPASRFTLKGAVARTRIQPCAMEPKQGPCTLENPPILGDGGCLVRAYAGRCTEAWDWLQDLEGQAERFFLGTLAPSSLSLPPHTCFALSQNTGHQNPGSGNTHPCGSARWNVV